MMYVFPIDRKEWCWLFHGVKRVNISTRFTLSLFNLYKKSFKGVNRLTSQP